MVDKQLIHISKFLSKHLRHQPERLGLTLEPGGWVEVRLLLDACERNQFPVSLEQLQEVVRLNDKQRFSFDDTGTRIRANQGHSVEVDLQLVPTPPPPLLYHGTAETSLASILEGGLQKMLRHHVHLSAESSTARKVGMRHGKPVVLIVDAAAMMEDGFEFYRSENGVWLVDHVPPRYIRVE
jgi:putative RNA 2'-phosphotransferase